MMVASDVILQGAGRINSEATCTIDEVDSPYNCSYFYVSLCNKCEHPFFVKQSLYGIPGEFESVVDDIVLFPSMKSQDLSNLPKEVEEAYEQAAKCFSASLYEPCALMCRKTLEVVCKNYTANGRSLYERLESLKKVGHIDSRLLSWSHEIRALGNDAAHAITANVTKADAKDCLDLTEAILIYIFTLGERFQQFKSRRQKPNKALTQ